MKEKIITTRLEIRFGKRDKSDQKGLESINQSSSLLVKQRRHLLNLLLWSNLPDKLGFKGLFRMHPLQFQQMLFSCCGCRQQKDEKRLLLFLNLSQCYENGTFKNIHIQECKYCSSALNVGLTHSSAFPKGQPHAKRAQHDATAVAHHLSSITMTAINNY